MHRVAAAFAIILIDLLGRAGLDKVLALSGSPETVALWAQLQSVVELVSGVAVAGVLQGLTVMTAQARDADEEPSLLAAGLRLAMLTSLWVAIVVAVAAFAFRGSAAVGPVGPGLLWLAALSGVVAVLPATLSAYWLGRNQQHRILTLTLFGCAVLGLIAAAAWSGWSLNSLMLVQFAGLAAVALVVWRLMPRLPNSGAAAAGEGQDRGRRQWRILRRFVPVGLTIGIMSPLSMLAMRGTLSQSLSWEEVGHFQAFWRSTEWVTALAAGALSLIFLPRLSRTFRSGGFSAEMVRAGSAVLAPAAALLLLTFLGHRVLLSMLYDARFAVSDMTAALFLLGSWVRIGSWLFLYGLFAAGGTRWIMAGEFLSMPLFALLIGCFNDGMTLERAALFYLLSYLAYLVFNAVGLRFALRGKS